MILKEPKKINEPSKSFYSKEELQTLDLSQLPSHLALLMDGNRRWAKLRGLPAEAGHASGASQLKKIVRACMELKIPALTVYTLSTENRSRSDQELKLLYQLLENSLNEELPSLEENNIRLNTIGNLEPLPQSLQTTLSRVKTATQGNTAFNLILAINYGGRDEIVRAFHRIEVLKRSNPHLEIDEKLISQNLDTSTWGDPEFVIRTSGEHRISNFLLWQISYSEIYFTSVYWPDFEPKHLLQALQCFQNRQIRRGL